MNRTMLGMMMGTALAGVSLSAQATATLTLNDGVNPTMIVLDNAAADQATGTGAVLVVTNVGIWQVIVSGITKPAFGSATSPAMDVSVQATSSGAGALTVTFSDNNFGTKNTTATGIVTYNETGSLLYGAGTVDFAMYGDPNNVTGALTDILADAGPQPWPLFITPFPGSFSLTAPFSVTEVMRFVVSEATHFNIDANVQLTLDITKGVTGCRVTGGSNMETNNSQSACVTTPPPTFVSHGGQVGASLSQDTAWSPNDPCISGEWEHNRHLTGSGLVGKLHASGNGNERDFDSLLCACLPCPQASSSGMVGNLCNPKNKICGPSPSPAPANKICFSGVGDFTYANGTTVFAVFRVDIEDRGEGNSHASPPPPDRYRIRIWLLDPNCGRDPNPASSANMTLRFGASADPNQIATLSTTENLKVSTMPAPDIDDGGDMVQGNHQIHFSTGASCP